MSRYKLLTGPELKAVREFIRTLRSDSQAMLEPLVTHVFALTAEMQALHKKLNTVELKLSNMPRPQRLKQDPASKPHTPSAQEKQMLALMREGKTATFEYRRLLASLKLSPAEAAIMYRDLVKKDI